MTLENDRYQTDRINPGSAGVSARRPSIPDGDRIARLAARTLNAPAGLLLTIEADRVTILGAHGVEHPSPVSIPFRPHLIDELFDAADDICIRDDEDVALARALGVIAAADIRAALGVPLTPPAGSRHALLVALDTEPRDWADQDRAALADLAALAGPARKTDPLVAHTDLLESIGEGVYSVDLDGICRYINGTGAALLGYEPGELIGRSIHDVVHHSYPNGTPMPKAECPITAAIASGSRAVVSTHHYWRRDGTSLPVEITVAPVSDGERVTGAVVSFSDISQLKETEEDLRFHKHIVDAVGQAVIANDNSPERRITYWNRAAERLLGWTTDEAIGRGFYETVPAEDFWPDVREIGKFARAGIPWQGDFRMHHRDGRVIPAIASVAPILDNDGDLLGVISVYTDMTEVKNTERQIRLYKHLLDSTGQALISSDANRTITYWNRAAEQMLGWTAEEVRGRGFYEVVPADDLLDEAARIGMQVWSGESWSGEFRLKRRDGSTFPVLMSVSPVIDDEGNPVQIVGAYTDISELKETEREIRFYKHVVEAVGQVIIANDLEQNITYWNRAAEDVLGWKQEEVLGKDAVDFAPALGFLPRIREIAETVRGGDTWTGEFLMQHRDGTQIPSLSSIKPIFDEDDNLIGVLGAHTDIRMLKETERELRIHKDMLDAVGQAVLATDESLRITYWNSAAAELYGYSVDEALGMQLSVLIPTGSDGIAHALSAGETLSHEHGWSGEMTAYGKDGSEITVLTTVTPILSDDDEQLGLIVAMADITQRRHTEEELKRSNQQIIEILETMGDGFLSLDRDWNITYMNRQAERFLHRDREMALGRNIWEEFPGADRRAFYSQYTHAMTTGESVDFTERYPEGDAWFEVHAFGSGDQLSIFFRDVTERINQENALREAEQRYRTLVEQLPALTYIASAEDDTVIRYISPQIETLMGFTVEEWLRDPRFWLSRVHPDDRPAVHGGFGSNGAFRDSYTIEYRQQSRSGEYRWIRDSATLIRDEYGNAKYWQGVAYDITDQKAAERKVHESEQRFRSLFEHNPDAVFSIDHSGRVLTANPAFVALTGVDPDRQGEFRFVDLVLPEDRERVNARFSETHQGEAQEFHASIVNRKDEHTALSIITIPITVDGEIVGVHVVAQDVTLNRELEQQLAHQAYHDALTGLPNRNLFQNRLTNRIDRSTFDYSRFAVLFFDLDDFKVINDSLGHSAGDQLLVKVAERVQGCIRDADLLARLGGDEFTLLLEEIDDESGAIVIADRIAEVLEESFMIDGHEVFVTVSIGIAIADQCSEHADDVLRNADLAMYEAKNSGKNRYAIFEPGMNSHAWLRLTLETELRRALERDEIEVYYQPIVDLTTGDLDGLEALVRWRHPERGFLEPDDFIEVAEQSGLIVPLGTRVVRQAVSELARWQPRTPDQSPPRLSINLSSRQYQQPHLVDELAEIIEQAGIDPARLTLEITETVAMNRSEQVVSMLHRLKETGVQLALDDFGTGFSALSYLRYFPIDLLKIDQSFVQGLNADPEDNSIVEAVMAASLAINLRVTAEGIETMDQLHILRQLGCHLGQGYLFSRPLSADDVQELLDARTLPWRQCLLDLSGYMST